MSQQEMIDQLEETCHRIAFLHAAVSAAGTTPVSSIYALLEKSLADADELAAQLLALAAASDAAGLPEAQS